MKRLAVPMLTILLAVSSGATGLPASEGPGSIEPTQAERREHVILRCSLVAASPRVVAYGRSANAPSRRVEDCAETLSLLSAEGYAPAFQAVSQEGEFLVVTLVRSP